MMAIGLSVILAGCIGTPGPDGAAPDDEEPAPPGPLRLYAREEPGPGPGLPFLSLQRDGVQSIGATTGCVDDGVVSGCGAGPFPWVNGSAAIPRWSEVVVHWELTSFSPGLITVNATLTAEGVVVAYGEQELLYLDTFLPTLGVVPVDIPLHLQRAIGPGEHLALEIEYEGTVGATSSGGGDWSSWIDFSNATLYTRGDR